MDIIIAFSTIVFGAFLGLAVIKWDSWRETAKRADLRGEWFAISHGGDHELVKDKVHVSKKQGKLYFKNEGNEYGYSYEAFCLVESSNILHGTWRSLRPGSSLRGRVLMIVNPQGTTITGIYTGANNKGADLILAWALARTEEGLEDATSSLQACFQFPNASENLL